MQMQPQKNFFWIFLNAVFIYMLLCLIEYVILLKTCMCNAICTIILYNYFIYDFMLCKYMLKYRE